MTSGAILPTAESPAGRTPGLVGWGLALLAVVHFLQWTVVQPADVQAALGFRGGDLEVGRWWSALTFPLAHPDLTLLAMNGYAIARFGSRLERTWGSGRFLAFVILAALGGWVFHLFLGGGGTLLGASTVAVGVTAAHAMCWGDEEYAFPGGVTLQVRWIGVFVVSLVLVAGLSASVGGGLAFLAHLGGVGAAWLFVRAAPVTLVERFRDGVSALPDEPPEDQLPRAVPRTLPRSRARGSETVDDVVARTNTAPAHRVPTRRRAEPQELVVPPSIDSILDKISAEGIGQLSEEERRVLDDHSRRLRDG